MNTIKKGIEDKQVALLERNTSALIEPTILLDAPSEDGDDVPAISSMISVEEEKDVAVDFAADADKANGSLDSSAKKLLEQ